MERHVFSYAFVDKVAPIQRRQLQAELKNFITTLTPSRKLNGKQFAWEGLVAILQLWLTCGLGNRGEVLQRMCEIPQGATLVSELASFNVGLNVAGRHGLSQPLTRDELDVVLRSFADKITTASELATLLNWSGFVERPPSAVHVLTKTLNSLAVACAGSVALQRLTEEVSARLEWGLSHFAPIAARRVLRFPAIEMLNWLKSSAFTTLKTPSVVQIIPGIRSPRPNGGDLTAHLHLLEYMQSNMEMEDVPDMTEIITGLLQGCCSIDTNACHELVGAWGMPLIANHTDAAVTVMKTALSRHFPTSSPQWSNDKSKFALTLCKVHALPAMCGTGTGPFLLAHCAGGLEARVD